MLYVKCSSIAQNYIMVRALLVVCAYIDVYVRHNSVSCEIVSGFVIFVPLVKKELPTLPKHLSSTPPVYVRFVLLNLLLYVLPYEDFFFYDLFFFLLVIVLKENK